MFSKVVVLCALLAVSQGAFVVTKDGRVVPVHFSPTASVHYSPAASVSSQSVVRHDELAPAARLAVAAPLAYRAAPAAVAYHAAPAPLAYRAPVAAVLAHREDQEFTHPKYEYNYSVADSHTGDNKSQQETRDGDVVRGSYSFHEADGSIRTVEYSADDHSGFNAVVHNSAANAAPEHVIRPIAVAPYYHH